MTKWRKFRAVDEEGNNLGEVNASSEASARMRLQGDLERNIAGALDTYTEWKDSNFKMEEVDTEGE
jgi:hypothetical protein